MLTKPIKTFCLWLFPLWLVFFSGTTVFAQTTGSACGSLANGYGPYDYRTDHDKLSIVTGAHFTAVVESLIRGTTNTTAGGDIDYTLRAIPNHHRALIAMMRLGEKEKTPQPRSSRYSVECWFERAIRFRPDDSIVRMIYSTYLNKSNRSLEANQQLEIATSYAKDSAFTHYNIGLHYFDLSNYEKALIQAHKAIELGFIQTALRDQLKSVGKWTDTGVNSVQNVQPPDVSSSPEKNDSRPADAAN